MIGELLSLSSSEEEDDDDIEVVEERLSGSKTISSPRKIKQIYDDLREQGHAGRRDGTNVP